MKLLEVVLFLVSIVAVYSNYPEVDIKDGKLKGKFMVTRKGRKFSGFLAIPFAKPPIGELRFKVNTSQIYMQQCCFHTKHDLLYV